MIIACSWCTAPMEVPENTPKESSCMCPACAEKEELHALRDGILIHAGQIALADDPDEAMEHVIALQDISNRMAEHGGERADVREIIRRGQGWARGPVRMNCLKLGIIEEVRAAA